MDREFMKSFYRNYYENPQGEATKDSPVFTEKHNLRYEFEDKFIEILHELGPDALSAFEQYMDAYTDEQEVVLEEMYLLGAKDREKMLTINRNTYIL